MDKTRTAITGVVGAVLILSSMVLLSGCIDIPDTGKVQTVITILPQKEALERIGGDLIEITVMIPKGSSPHSYDPLPSQLIRVSTADVYFKVGSGVEFEENHLGTIKEQNSGMRIVDCSEGIRIKSFSEHGEEEHIGEDDNDHGGTDPHIWLSPVNYGIMAVNILNGLIEVDPENEETYRSNFNAYKDELDSTVENMSAHLSPYAGRYFLAYHPSWGYFGDDFDLHQIAIENEGQQPGPSGIASIIEQAGDHNITVVFVSNQYDTTSARIIADEIGGEVVTVDPLPENYISSITDLSEKMAAGFQNGR
ncbi:MAG: metal ABC transporter solute-binding protein, Zn/Mn family [Thermoplasmatota archaeon]